MSDFLEKCKLPSEIHRPVRGLNELTHWKGTEYRSFLLYVSIVVVRKFFDDPKIFQHFLLYYCAVVICTRSDQCPDNLNIAESMFQDFLVNFKVLYGIDFFSSNLHNLCHVVDDVRKFGPLETFSAYPFESKLFVIKRLLRSGNLPLSQVAKRISELQQAKLLKRMTPVKSDRFKLQNEMKQFDEADASFLSFLKCQNATIYVEVELPKFSLRSDVEKNRWFLSKAFEIVCVKFIIAISKNENTNVFLYGSALKKATNYFEYPVRSSELNIYQSDCDKKAPSYYSLEDIYCKLVKVEYDSDTSVFIPLYHTIEID